MIGEEYFELRSKLGADLHVLAGLVEELNGSSDDLHIVKNLITSLDDPFVFVVVGEGNVGKSTFLNALFRADFSHAGVMPPKDRICFYKHGSELRSTTIDPSVEEVHVPCDFLKDFHIVDTPGTDSIENKHQQITGRFVPMADLVVFVFSAMNPWAPSSWQFLERVHRHWLRNVIFVLQQCDLRSAEEIQVITDYMAQLSLERFHRHLPLFAISAKKASLARSSGTDREHLLADSGLPALEAHISETVTQSPARLAKLGSALCLAQQVLDQVSVHSGNRLKQVQERLQRIEDMQAGRRAGEEQQAQEEAKAHDRVEHPKYGGEDAMQGHGALQSAAVGQEEGALQGDHEGRQIMPAKRGVEDHPCRGGGEARPEEGIGPPAQADSNAEQGVGAIGLFMTEQAEVLKYAEHSCHEGDAKQQGLVLPPDGQQHHGPQPHGAHEPAHKAASFGRGCGTGGWGGLHEEGKGG